MGTGAWSDSRVVGGVSGGGCFLKNAKKEILDESYLENI